MKLVKKNCDSERERIPLNKEQIKKYLLELGNRWELADKYIKKEFAFKSFKKGISFVNKIAKLTEKEKHHPEIHIFYNRVILKLWIHSVNGLSENDFILAAKINKL